MKTLTIILFLLFLLPSCGGYKESVKQSQEQAFLSFTGNAIGASFSVDNGDRVTIGEGSFVYKLKPGKHEVKVFRGGQTVVQRQIYIGDQETVEVQVP